MVVKILTGISYSVRLNNLANLPESTDQKASIIKSLSKGHSFYIVNLSQPFIIKQ